MYNLCSDKEAQKCIKIIKYAFVYLNYFRWEISSDQYFLFKKKLHKKDAGGDKKLGSRNSFSLAQDILKIHVHILIE